MLKSFRYLLLPISLLYWLVIWIRNRLFDRQVLKSSKFNFPIICVGNLAVGGTGKTPMVELLLRFLHQQFQTATISRGYKRKTKGFGIAGENTTALEIGDEPMQFHRKFPDVVVAVGEERLEAIPQLLQEKPGTEVIILDDAFQHRSVTAGLNILLTEFSNLYTRDFALPAGDLRDIRRSASRAEIIVVTKCPANMDESTKRQLLIELCVGVNQKVYFTSFDHSLPTHLFQPNLQCKLQEGLSVLLVCGIANPKPLKEFLNQQVKTYDMLRFPDHHIFDSDDLKEMLKQFEQLATKDKIILTTEKDGVRLLKFEQELLNVPIFVIPVAHHFLFNEGNLFENQILQFINSFEKPEIDTSKHT